MARHPSARSLSRLRNYTVEETASALNVHRNTVRRWLRAGLEPIDWKKPYLIHGTDLIEFLKSRSLPATKLLPHEGFCFSCRAPREPAFAEIEVEVSSNGRLSLTALCDRCTTVMHKKLARDLLPVLQANPAVSVTLVRTRLNSLDEPSANVHFKEEPYDHTPSPPQE